MEMSDINSVKITRKEVLGSGILTLLSGGSMDSYRKTLREHTTEQDDVDVYTVFLYLVNFHFNPTDSGREFETPFNLYAVRRPNPDHLTDEQTATLKEISSEINDPELKARVCDFIWLKTKDVDCAKNAILAYLESALNLENREKWTTSADRIHRAFYLVRLLSNQELEKKVVSQIKDTIQRINGSDPSFYTHNLLSQLYDQKYNIDEYKPLIESIAQKAADEQNWWKSESYWELLRTLLRKEKNDLELIRVTEALSENCVKQAEISATAKKPSHFGASGELQSAITLLMELPNEEKRNLKINRLHKILLEYQKKIPGEMTAITSDGVDISKTVKRAKELVTKESVKESINTLCVIQKIPETTDIRKQVEESIKNHVFMHIASETLIDSSGKTKAKKEALLGSESTKREAAVLTEMYRCVGSEWAVIVQGVIEPARMQINADHRINKEDFNCLLNGNPLVMVDRKSLLALGLWYGMLGRFSESAHILVNQLENILRLALIQNNLIPVSITPRGIQKDFTLSKIFTSFESDLKKVFTEDIYFNLRALLIEEYGANLRNNLNHGLMSYDEIENSVSSRYLWWITMHILFLAKATYQRKDFPEE